jgi:hypothetical protein
MKTFNTLTGAAFDKMGPQDFASLSKEELVRLTFRIGAIMGAIATFITATEAQAIFDISEAKTLNMTRNDVAALEKLELEQLVTISQEILRLCPIKPGCR